MTSLIRWCRVLLAGWDRWITTAAQLHGTQTDPSYHAPEQCSTPTPAGHAPGSATTAPTPHPPPAAGTSPRHGEYSRYPHPPAAPRGATTYPSTL